MVMDRLGAGAPAPCGRLNTVQQLQVGHLRFWALQEMPGIGDGDGLIISKPAVGFHCIQPNLQQQSEIAGKTQRTVGWVERSVTQQG
jgi:hypothetical protein